MRLKKRYASTQGWKKPVKEPLLERLVCMAYFLNPLLCLWPLSPSPGGAFSHVVTAAILVSRNNKTAAMFVSQTNPVRVELFFLCKNVLLFQYIYIPACHMSKNTLWQAGMQMYWNKRTFLHSKKSSTPRGLVWDTNMAAVLLFRNTNMAAVTSCENTKRVHVASIYANLLEQKKFLHKKKVQLPSDWSYWGHFRVAPSLCFKTRLSARPLIWK